MANLEPAGTSKGKLFSNPLTASAEKSTYLVGSAQDDSDSVPKYTYPEGNADADGDGDVEQSRTNVYGVGGVGNTHRRLTARHVTFIGFGGGIGTGLFIGTGSALAKAGPAGLLLAYIIVGAILWCVMESLGELATLVSTSAQKQARCGIYHAASCRSVHCSSPRSALTDRGRYPKPGHSRTTQRAWSTRRWDSPSPSRTDTVTPSPLRVKCLQRQSSWYVGLSRALLRTVTTRHDPAQADESSHTGLTSPRPLLSPLASRSSFSSTSLT
jgi:hypothetical protein